MSIDESMEESAVEEGSTAPFTFRGRRSGRGTAAEPVVTTEADPEIVDEVADPGGDDVPPRRRQSGLGGPIWALLVISLIAAVLAFISWRSVAHDPDRDRAALRDDALIEGTAGVVTMTSMDHRNVAAGIKAWQTVSTGVLHDQLVSIGADEEKMLADQGKIATGRVVEAALSELSDRTATLIAAVEVTVSEDDPNVEPTVKRNRFSADLVLVNGHWKIENLQQVAVGL